MHDDYSVSTRVYVLRLYTVSQKTVPPATLTMAITLSILGDLLNSFIAEKSTKFSTQFILGCPPHPKCVAVLRWKT